MKSFSLSPGCSSKELKSTDCLLSLGGVPVLSLPVFNSKALKKLSKPEDFLSLIRPPSFFSWPIKIEPFRNVPVVKT